METATARMSAKGQLVIPKAVQRGWASNLRTRPFLIDGDTVIMRPPKLLPRSCVSPRPVADPDTGRRGAPTE